MPLAPRRYSPGPRLAGFTFHFPWHTCATLLLSKNVNPKIVQSGYQMSDPMVSRAALMAAMAAPAAFAEAASGVGGGAGNGKN